MGFGTTHLVCEYKQARHLPTDPEVKQGICAAVTLQWIAWSANGKGHEFWEFIISDDGKANAVSMQRREQQTKKLWAEQQKQMYQLAEKHRQNPHGDFKDEDKIQKAAVEQLRDGHMRDEFHKNYLDSKGLKRLGTPESYKTGGEVSDRLTGFNGYAFISSRSKDAKGHAISAYISNNDVRIMDPNHGEMFISSPDLAILGLTQHLESQKDFLGELESFVVEFYPCSNPPGQREPSQSAQMDADVGYPSKSNDSLGGGSKKSPRT